MTTAGVTGDDRVAFLLRKASDLDARGEWNDAVATWATLVDRASDFLPAKLGLAQALIRAERPAEALPWLEAVTATTPSSPAAWLALAVARSMLVRHDAAVTAAERAVECAPDLAAAHLGLGDVLRHAGRFFDAASSYRRAVELAPDDPDALNKAAATARTQRQWSDAEAMLRRALAMSPKHPQAHVNLGTLLLETERVDEGRAVLAASARLPGLPEDARTTIDDAFATLREREQLAPSIAAAAERDDPAPIAATLRSLARSRDADQVLLRDLSAIAGSLSTRRSDLPLAAGVPVSRAWPAIEAHHSVLPSRDMDAIARSVELVAHPERAASATDHDIVRYARAVARRQYPLPDTSDAVAFEAWIRLRHAQVVGHRPAIAPGQFKLVNNLMAATGVPRSRAPRVPATLAVVLGDLAPRIAFPALRAVFVYLAVLEMHPFADGNGRVMRLALNASIARTGHFPFLREPGSDGEQLNRARDQGDIGPLLEHLADGSRRAAALDRAWVAREAD